MDPQPHQQQQQQQQQQQKQPEHRIKTKKFKALTCKEERPRSLKRHAAIYCPVAVKRPAFLTSLGLQPSQATKAATVAPQPEPSQATKAATVAPQPEASQATPATTEHVAPSPASQDNTQQESDDADALSLPPTETDEVEIFLGDDAEVHEVPFDDEDHVPSSGEGDLTDDGDEDGATAASQRRKTTHVFISDEQEQMLGEWVQEHPFLYDRGHQDFKDVHKKSKLFEEKGRTLEPPLTGKQLSTWLRSIRTRYGRLTKDKSGQARRDLTAREKWILQVFHFFGRHIVRQKKTRTLGLKQVRKCLSVQCIC